MALADHDRLDKKLNVLHYTQPACGSLNLGTGQAEYCGYDCPTLKARMQAGEDPGLPINQADAGTRSDAFDPGRVGPQ